MPILTMSLTPPIPTAAEAYLLLRCRFCQPLLIGCAFEKTILPKGAV